MSVTVAWPKPSVTSKTFCAKPPHLAWIMRPLVLAIQPNSPLSTGRMNNPTGKTPTDARSGRVRLVSGNVQARNGSPDRHR